ncbi:MAG: 3-dehydroquinate synthase [Chloroflexota bacterium]
MRMVELHLGENSYRVLIGAGLIQESGKHLKELGFSGKVVVVTDPIVRGLYADALTASLKKAGFEPSLLEVPAGEEHKSLDSAVRLYQELDILHAERRTPILALGGGVIGDLAGFVAATYLRGVPFIQLPTTLLSQVDSSTGGKVGVDMNQLKNRIGAFYQPKLVLADVTTLRTLPPRQLNSGLAEVIKAAVILDRGLFELLEQNVAKLKALDEVLLSEVIFRAVGIKAGFVEKDERDTGIRNVLNLGHTVGHAIESVSDFALSHGEAVAIGMVAASRIASKMGLLPAAELERIRKLLVQVGLPVEVPKLDRDLVFSVMTQDKKVTAGRLRFILPRAIGSVIISDEVSSEAVKEVLT